jgi:mannitol/fructose-specific phosphotransferase system IIA component (Ntr-type)
MQTISPPPGFFDNFATYLELNRLYLSCENQEEVDKEAAKKMTTDDIVRHRLFEESLIQVRNRVLFTTANGYAGLGP